MFKFLVAVLLFLIGLLALGSWFYLPYNHLENAPEPTITPVVLITITPALDSPATTAPVENQPSPTPAVVVIPTIPPVPTATQVPFQAQPGTPRYIPAFAHLDESCTWRGAAGQIFNEDGQGLAQIVITITGEKNGKSIDQVALSANESVYGPGGYEVNLAPFVAAGIYTARIQLFDQEGRALTEALPFIVPTTCDGGLILMNFRAEYLKNRVFLPLSLSSN